jgi:hypothetical protein
LDGDHQSICSNGPWVFGNAVVPQFPQIIGEAIMTTHQSKCGAEMTDAELVVWIGDQLARNNLMWDGRNLIIGHAFFYGPDIGPVDFREACLQASQANPEAAK